MVEAALGALPIRILGLMRRSSNYTFLARLGGGDGQPDLLAIYKPAQGESPLWDFPAGTLYQREVAAYRVARELGWPRVPPTIARDDAPHGVGAVQYFVDAEPGFHYLAGEAPDPETWVPVAVFDVLTNNADRKAGHCLRDPTGHVWLIDHGLTFHEDPKLRTVIWDFSGRRLPGRLRPGLERVAAGIADGELGAELRTLLSGAEVAVLQRRVEAALAPRWTLPRPSSAWSVPWPPV